MAQTNANIIRTKNAADKNVVTDDKSPPTYGHEYIHHHRLAASHQMDISVQHKSSGQVLTT